MDSQSSRKWQYLALGGTCAAVAVLGSWGCRSKRKGGKEQKAGVAAAEKRPAALHNQATSKAGATPPAAQTRATPAPRAPSSAVKSFDELDAWAAGLKKRDADEFPALLASTEKLLREQPEHEALPSCLKALTQLVGGNQESERVSVVAVKAGARCGEQAFDVLNALFKDRKQRGGFVADAAVVDFALDTLKRSTQGGVERGTYQRACKLLTWISLDPENRELLAARGGSDTLLQVMQAFPDDQGVLLEGCACLQSLAEEPQLLDLAQARKVAMSTLQSFPKNGELCWRALAALHNLPMPDKQLRIPIAELSRAAATTHPRCDTPSTVPEWSSRLLFKLAKDDSEVHDWLKAPAQVSWLAELKKSILTGRKVNRETDRWVKELCRLAGV